MIHKMNSNVASKFTNIYSDSDSDSKELIGLPVFDGKNWNKGWDSIAKQARLEKDLFEMVEADIAASLQGAPVVTKKLALTKHAIVVTARMTALSKGVIPNLSPSFEKPSSSHHLICAQSSWAVCIQDYEAYEVAERGIKVFIVAVVKKMWIRDLHYPETFYSNVTALALLDHLCTHSGSLHTLDMASLTIQMSQYYEGPPDIPE